MYHLFFTLHCQIHTAQHSSVSVFYIRPLTDSMWLLCTQVPDNYTPPAPITAPVMGFPVEAPQPHNHAQVPPGAPQEPNVQVGVRQGGCFVNSQQQRTRETRQHLVFVSLFSSAPPAAASREGGAERNPSWTHGPQIHLWQPGAALPASSKRPSKSHCVCVQLHPHFFCVCNKACIDWRAKSGFYWI